MATDKQDRPDPADLAVIGKTEAQFMAEVAEARQRAETETPDDTRISGARYDEASGRVVIDLANEMTLMVPAHRLQALAGAKPEDLEQIEILGTHTLDWPSIDQQVYVPDLLRGIYGTRHWMAELGRHGGKIKSAAKSAAARANGKKGGRPRKAAP